MVAPWPFASDGSKKQLLKELGVLHALEGPADSWALDALLISARVHCLSKVGQPASLHTCQQRAATAATSSHGGASRAC